jgi:glyoxylase-like metal-dependent hydrolase (beta-lactamase superfamily II)
VLLAGVAGSVSAQQEDLSGVEIKSAPLGTGLYLLTGAGGNIAALTGTDGVLLVDAEFGPLAERIRAALKGLGAEQPPRFIIDTHYHYDHTDGNEAFARTGATVIAQTQLRSRLAAGGTIGNGGSIAKEMKPVPPAGLPGVTYEQELTLYLDGEAVRVHHYPHAHTDGDSVVFFPRAKVVHMGDIFVRYGFPFIDINGGGNVRGMIAACEDVVHSVPPDTRIIPGHGEVATVAELREYSEMLKSTTALVEQALAAGKTLEQMKQEKLLGAYSARYAPAKAFVDTDAFTESLYNSLKMPRPRHGPVRRPR